jgi:hypothetical protein
MRDRTEGDGRYDYWFPLALLGFGLLALLGMDSLAPSRDFDYVANAPGSAQGYLLNPGMQYSTTVIAVGFGQPLMLDWPWAALVTVTLVGTVLWYGWRARRAGTGSVRGYLVLAVTGAIAVPVGYLVAAIAGTAEEPAAVTTSIGLPLVVLGGLAGLWARVGPRRWVPFAISVPCLVIGVATVLGAWWPELFTPVVVAVGLLVLAWIERSRFLVVVAGVVPVALVASPEGTLSTLIPAVLVLAASVVALARRAPAFQ